MALPIPEDDDPRMNPEGRLFLFIEPQHWMEIFQQLTTVRNSSDEENVLYAACQALMAEVGYQHTARKDIIELVEPEDSSPASTLDAIRFLVRSPQPVQDPVDNSVAPKGDRNVELAVQRVLSRVQVVPSDLPVAQFLDLCEQVSGEINGFDGVSEASGSQGDTGIPL